MPMNAAVSYQPSAISCALSSRCMLVISLQEGSLTFAGWKTCVFWIDALSALYASYEYCRLTLALSFRAERGTCFSLTADS